MLLSIDDTDAFYVTLTDHLTRGGIIGLPTDTVYGLAVDAENETALEKLNRLKDRETKPYTFFMPKSKLGLYAQVAKPKLLDFFVPGPLTAVMKKQVNVRLPLVQDRIGIRIPQVPFILRLLNSYPRPLAVTSANHVGQPTCSSPYEIIEDFTDVEVVVDGGRLEGLPSTVLDLTASPPVVLRKGKIPILEIEKVYGRTVRLAEGNVFNVLFVCTGNTCRSPMAMAIFQTLIDPVRVKVRSAGINTADGLPAAPHAAEVVRRFGGALDEHRTIGLTPGLVLWSDLILVMEFRHYEFVLQYVPEAVSKTFLLKEYKRNTKYTEVRDPVGKDLDAYLGSAEDMLPSLKFVAKEIMKRFAVK